MLVTAGGGYLLLALRLVFPQSRTGPAPGREHCQSRRRHRSLCQQVEPRQEVITIKQGLAATLTDIVREDLAAPKILIGIFMSPFSVHYNRAPLPGRIKFIRHHPARLKNYCMALDALAHRAETAALLREFQAHRAQ